MRKGNEKPTDKKQQNSTSIKIVDLTSEPEGKGEKMQDMRKNCDVCKRNNANSRNENCTKH